MDNAVAIAAIGLAATTVGGLIWAVKFLGKTLSADIREHTVAATKLAQASDRQEKASNEVLTFMKKLNGKLPKLVEEIQRQAAKE